jgi:monofunctional biosynthetic peptidoglycan transglycosylase
VQAKYQSDPSTRRRRWLRWLWKLPLVFVLVTVLQVLVLRFVDPPFSAFMAERQLSSWAHGDWSAGILYDWRDLDTMAPSLPLALVAAEDQTFESHNGFDFKAIEKARVNNARGRKMRGGSTISQQVAKNLFLWSGRSWIRKGIEAWYTVLIEAVWSKHRILEMYANVAEFGDGIYGAQAASRHFFGKDASHLSASDSARLAAVLPSPIRYDAGKPGPYVQRRSNGIQRQMHHLGGAALPHPARTHPSR